MNQRRVGAILSYVNIAVNIGVQLLYVPILLKFIGKEDFGLYQLIGSLISYMAIMDFGLSITIIRYYSKYDALKQEREKENILFMFSIIYLVLASVCVFLGALLYINFDRLYGASLSSREILLAKQMFLVLLFNIAITIPSHIFTAVITAKEKFVILKGVTIIQALIKPVAVIAVLSCIPDVLYVVYIDTICNVLIIITYIIVCLKLHIRFKYYYWDKNLLKEISAFSFFVFLNSIVDLVYWKTGQLILGAVSGAASVAVYAISMQICMLFMTFSTAVSGVFLPQITALATSVFDMKAIDDIFIRIGRIQLYIVGLIFSGFVLFGRYFIILWVGNGFSGAYLMTVFVMAGLLIPLVQNVGISILQAMNKHAFRSVVYTVIAILNFVISIVVAKHFGGLGCAAVTACSLFAGNGLIVNCYYHKYIGLSIKNFFRQILRISVPIVIYCIICFFALRFVEIKSFITFSLYSLLYLALYTIVIFLFSFNEYEKSLFCSLLRRVRKG